MSESQWVETNGRPRILGGSLGLYIGRRITLFGEIISVGADKKSLKIRSSDNVEINVYLNADFVHPTDGGVEIHGKPKSKTTIEADYHWYYPPETLKEFVSSDYVALITSVGGALGSKAMILNE